MQESRSRCVLFCRTPSLQAKANERGAVLFSWSGMERKTRMKNVPQSDEQLRQEVSTRYARTALQVLGAPSEQGASCCGPAEMVEPILNPHKQKTGYSMTLPVCRERVNGPLPNGS